MKKIYILLPPLVIKAIDSTTWNTPDNIQQHGDEVNQAGLRLDKSQYGTYHSR